MSDPLQPPPSAEASTDEQALDAAPTEIAASAISNAASAPYAIAAPVGAQNGNGNGNGHQRVVEGEVARPATGPDDGSSGSENVQRPDAG